MKIGKISDNVLKRSVLQQIRNSRKEVVVGAGQGEDCAIFSLNAGMLPGACHSTHGQSPGCKNDRYVSDNCVIIPCMQEGVLPVTSVLQRAVNIIAARGAEALAVSLSMLLPTDAEEEALRGVVAEAESFCAGLDMQIVQARGRVTPAVTEVFVTVTAYGRAEVQPDGLYHTVRAAGPGQDIVVSKWIGLEGTAILAKRYRADLMERYPAWLSEEAAGFERYLSVVQEAAVAVKSGVCAIHNVSEGGILSALWELAEGAGVGLTIDLKKLPIRQETVEICNHCNVNPYELLSGGCLLMTAEDGAGLRAALEAEGISAAVVGRITDSNDRLILNEDEVRYLNRPHADSIFGALV